MAPFRQTVFWSALVCVVALLLFVVWWNAGDERDKTAGKQPAVGSGPPREPRRSLGEWLKSWGFFTGGLESQGGSASREVEEAVKRTFLAYNNQDLRTFMRGWTDNGFQQAFELPKEKVTGLDQLSLLSFRPYTVGEFSNTSLDAKTAATEVGLTYGEVHETHRFSLVREDDAWKIDQDEKLALIPKDATVIDAKLNFFIIELERTRLTPGTVAFKISNGDTRPHEFIVKKVTPSESEETIGMTKELKPGASETLILTKLTPGRYVALCNMVTEDFKPYAYGMRTEFLIE